jgi:lysophospholipase L1-like esterase
MKMSLRLPLLVLFVMVAFPGGLAPELPTSALYAQDCARRYVAGGDHIPAGHEVEEDERYPNKLLEDKLKKWGPWCVYVTAENEATSSQYISGGNQQLSQTWNLRPDLITLTVGGENNQIIKLITECFDNIKDHDFAEASACASGVLGNTSAWNQLTNNLTTTLQQYRMILAGRPKLVVAVTGYPNPYPKALDVAPKIAELCTPLIDTIITCTVRWVQLPPALELLDQTIKKLNTTIQNAVKPFTLAQPTAGRFFYVDIYTKTRDHCMKMDVKMKTKVEHPELEGTVHDHDNTTEVSFGCSDPWYVEGEDGTKNPFYLFPSIPPTVLLQQSQTTSGMGVHPNDKGHKCISELIWEHDTPEPGVTPLKWKLSIPEAANSNICQGS